VKILIVGGTGVISTAISRELLQRNEDVTLFNRGQTSPRMDPLLYAKATVVTGDRKDHAIFERQMAELGTFDCVIDMICFTEEEAASALRAFGGRCGQYIFCSTVDVYTKPAQVYPIKEHFEREPRPSFPYAYQKGKCERLLFAAHDAGQINLTAIRPAHTYGPGGRTLLPMGFGSYQIDRMRRGLPMIVHGNGRSLWASCSRDDVGHAFVGAVGNETAKGRGYHVSAEEWITWDQYHQYLAEAMGWPEPQLVHIPIDVLAQAAPKAALWCVENFGYDNIFDNSAARGDLGFAYTVPFRQGMAEAVQAQIDEGPIDLAESAPFYDRLIAAWHDGVATMLTHDDLDE